jgi:hypothetical protein
MVNPNLIVDTATDQITTAFLCKFYQDPSVHAYHKIYVYNLYLAQTACLLQDDKGKCVWSMKAKRQVKEAVFLKAP